MKYLTVARGLNKPDNNVPSWEILVRVVDIEPTEKEGYKKAFEKELSEIYDYGVEVVLYELDQLQDSWGQVATDNMIDNYKMKEIEKEENC